MRPGSRNRDDLSPNAANFVALSPVSFLDRTASNHGSKLAIVNGGRQFTYAEVGERCRRLAAALSSIGTREGDTVAILAPNVPEMIEAHFGVPMCGAVLNAINIRLSAPEIAFILDHGKARVLIVHVALIEVARRALGQLAQRPRLVVIGGPATDDALAYDEFLDAAEPRDGFDLPGDEWASIALNYTSGTTGNPKGALYHHRGAFLNAAANALTLKLDAQSVYLWTLPMFHCNGWSHIWALALVGATSVCLDRIEPDLIVDLIERHGVTHLAGAPVVLAMLAEGMVGRQLSRPVKIAIGGAPPPSITLERLEAAGFQVTHLYGMTECYGPATHCEIPAALVGAASHVRAKFLARQGVGHPMLGSSAVVDPETMRAVPADGVTRGELVLRGNTVMKGYLANPGANMSAFAGGWLHTGDLAVVHPDRHIEIKDRAKDVIISGGENISSVEVEEVLYRHPDIAEAAVVGVPDPKWGEVLCAFVNLHPGTARNDPKVIRDWCRAYLAGFKIPKYVLFGELPKTATGKIQKFALRKRGAEMFDQVRR